MGNIFKQTWVAAVIVTVLFFLTQFTLGRLLGVNHETMTSSTEEMKVGLMFRFSITATIFTVIALWARKAWNGGIYAQPGLPELPRWLWLIPILMVVQSVVKIAVNEWDQLGLDYVMILLVGVLLVGVAEETTFRGINIRAIRGSTRNEFAVLLLSSLLFGLVHGVNILNGQDAVWTMGQIANTFVGGAGFYIVLRLSGSLLIPILLHALWDFSVLGRVGEEASLLEGATLIGQVAVWGLTIVAAAIVFRQSRRSSVQS